MRIVLLALVLAVTAMLALLLLRDGEPPEPAAGFEDTIVLRDLREPLSVAFAADGRVFVAEKRGAIRVFPRLGARASTLWADLGARLFTDGDRGLFGLALDPRDGAVYVLYTFDGPVGANEPLGRRRCPELFEGGCVVSGRLSRLERGGREKVLVAGWCQQFPSHGVGDLVFGEDGILYASGGEGASYERVDTGAPADACGDPPGEGGALRAQARGTSGAVIGVDVRRGSQRVQAYGLRNPFRIAPRPGSSELWIGDVGSTRADELDAVDTAVGARNFGWPCYEGDAPLRSYDEAGVPTCERLYAAETAVAPEHVLLRDDEVLDGDGCGQGTQAISGLAFYRGGGSYPARYRGALFFADHVRRCLWVVLPDGSGRPDLDRIELFRRGIASPVKLVTGPGGDLYYLDFAGGALHRIRYVG